MTDEHRAFRRELREFLDQHVEPIAEEYERTEKFPSELLLGPMAERGYLGLPFPKEYGGAGKDAVTLAILIEETSRVWGSLGIILAAHIGLGSNPIFAFGSEEQKKKYLTPLAQGKRLGGYGSGLYVCWRSSLQPAARHLGRLERAASDERGSSDGGGLAAG